MERFMDGLHDLLWEDDGFGTVGVAIALLLTLSLLFTGARVYDIETTSANVQDVADASVLAAANTVGEYYIVAEVCDAILLSFSLGSLTALGLGVAAACIPFTAPASSTLVKVSKDLAQTRDRFAKTSTEGLNKLQRALPFLALVQAGRVMAKNSGPDDASYRGIVVLSPWKGEELNVPTFGKSEEASEAVDAEIDELKDEGEDAETAAERANRYKQEAYEHDSGSKTEHCMYERAKTLAKMKGKSNPYYSSAETWSFSVAMKRAKKYYPKRLKMEKTDGSSVAERSNSALRKRFYRYAVKEIKKGYVHETESSFDAFFPLLPKNTSEMRKTELYTQRVYPISVNEDGTRTMHAWKGCPGRDGKTSAGKGSISQLDGGSFVTCPYCDFVPSSMGKVAAASTSIENGFEHHYRIVAEMADKYQKAMEDYWDAADEAKGDASSLLDKVKAALGEAATTRIDPSPPGEKGAVAIVVDTSTHSPNTLFPTRFVDDAGSLGLRVALSSAVLVQEESEEGRTVITSLLDGYAEGAAGSVLGPARVALGMWSGLLVGYADGHDALASGIKEAFDALPLASESGLGEWAAGRFTDFVESVGLQPPDLRARKAVLANSAHALKAGKSGFSARLLSAKNAAMTYGSNDGNALSSALSQVEGIAMDSVSDLKSGIELASLKFFDGAMEIPLVVALPDALASGMEDGIALAFQYLKSVAIDITGERRWR